MYTYIVIDDEELTRKGTIAKLKPLKDMVECVGEAGDGKEALLLIESTDPDIIITDMNMPNISGAILLPMLAESYPDKPIIVISGYKDFEYTKQAIRAKAVDYLLKPFGRDDIGASVHKAINYIKSAAQIRSTLSDQEQEKENACYEYDIQALKNLILGYHSEALKLTSKRLSFINNTHNFILMTLHSPELLNENQIHDYLQENGFGDLALFLQYTNNRHLGFFILFIPEQSVLNPVSVCSQIAGNFEEQFDSRILAGISRVHDELFHLHDAFLETVTALDCRTLTDSRHICIYEGEKNAVCHFKWCREEELLFRIETGEGETIPTLVDELFLYLKEFEGATYLDIKYYCYQLSESTRTILYHYFDQPPATSIYTSTQSLLNTMFTVDEMKEYYLQFFINISKFLYDNNIYASDDTISKIRLYIEKNYYKDLSLELLSSFFYLNRSYLSHLFKSRTGQNFVDYLNDVRIEKAKLLLMNSDKKMYQIAKATGYDNIKYFFRIFKKKTGVTPEQWKITHQGS